MSTIPVNPVDDTKPETAPAIPTTAAQRLAHTNINSAFGAARTDVEALETGKEDAGTAASQVAAHDASGTAHGSVEANFGTHTSGQTNSHAQLDSHVASTANPHSVTAAQAGALEDVFTANGDLVTQAAGITAKVGIGTAGQVLTVTGGQPAWEDAAGGALPDISQWSMYARLSAGSGPGEEMVVNSLGNVVSPAGSESVLAMLSTGELRRILVSNFPTGGGGEVNVSTTPAVVGANQADINMAKSGSDLQKRAIYGSTSIGVTENAQDITLTAIEAGIDHDSLLNFSAAEHFTEASIDHTAITNVGTNTHGQIDTHIASGTIHFTEASIVHNNISGLTTGDPHTQYHNDARGDARYTPIAHVGSGGAEHAAFTNVAAGFVPASGGGTTNFLRADGTFAAPAGGGDMLSPASMAVGELYSAGDTAGVQTAATGILASAVARLDAAADFTSTLSEQSIGAIYQAAAAAETGTYTPTLSAGNTPRRYTNAALTVNLPTGDGDAVLMLGPSANLTVNGGYTILGSRTASQTQTCYISNDVTNTQTIFAYGASS